MSQIITRTPEQAYDLWISALRSGKYRQTTGELHNSHRAGKDNRINHSFCCLGVACDLARKDGGPKWTTTNMFTDEPQPAADGHTFMGESALMPTELRKFLGMTRGQVNRLVKMNDTERATFVQISDVIEMQIKPAALLRLTRGK